MGSLRTDLEAAAPTDALTAARRALEAVFPETALHPDGSPLPLARFQAEAAARLLRLLEIRGGALLADSVGLGKTHVAMAVIGETIRAGSGPVLVVTPAALRRQWAGPLRRVALDHGVPFAQAGPAVSSSTSPWVEWTSHARLSMGRVPACRPALIVVDEAHAFRNPHTRRYRQLAGLCAGARVLLLTATPVNNSLADLYFLLRLFLGDGDLADLGVSDLRDFLRPDAAGAGPSASRTALAALTVRRTRRLLEAEPAASRLRFPAREGCYPVRYDLASVWGPAGFECLVRLIAELRLEVHDVAAGSDPARGGSHLVRTALLKRLESSVAAFARSVDRLDGFLRACSAGIPFGRLPSGREMRGEDPGQIPFAALLRRDLSASVDAGRLADSVVADLGRLERIRAMIRSHGGADPKLHALQRLLGNELAGRSVLVFSEFGDTARAIHRVLARSWPTGLVTGRESLLGSGRTSRRRVIEAFAPVSNGASVPASERIRILVATDVLSEGLNLQDSGDLVSYDLPWNPVRLVQRAGRIDRPGSPHDAIRIYNLLPDSGLDTMLRLMDRIRSKVAAIRAAGGFDAPALPDRPAPGPDLHELVRRLQGNDPKVLQDLEIQAEHGYEVEERARRVTRGHGGRLDPGREGRPRAPPVLAALPRPAGEAVGWLAITSDGRVERFLFVRRGAVSEDRAGALRLLADATAGAALAPPPLPDPGAEDARDAIDAASRHLVSHGGARTRGADPAGKAARLLLRRLGSVPGAPSRELCARADVLLDRLRPGLDRGAEAALGALLRTEARRPGPCEDLMDQLEALVRGGARNRDPGHPAGERQRLVALFRLSPGTELVMELGPR